MATTPAKTAGNTDAVYEWEGKDKNGKQVRGEIRAGGEKQVKSALRRYAADFQRKSGLDATNRPVTILEAVWWTRGITKPRPDKLLSPLLCSPQQAR